MGKIFGKRLIGWLLGLACISLGLEVSSVGGHASLQKAFPAIGGTVTEVPDYIELTFSENIDDGNISLYTLDGTQLPTTMQTPPDSTMLKADIDNTLTIGEYSVVWTAVSTDGHQISGSYNFSYASVEIVTAADSEIEEIPLAVPLVTIVMLIVAAGAVIVWRRRKA